MPYQNPESVGLQYTSSYDYSGGLVTNYNFSLLKPNQLIKALNCDLVTDGAIVKRKGRTKQNSSAVTGNSTIHSLFTIGQPSGADYILGGHDTRFSYFPVSAAPVLIRSGLTNGALMSAATINDYLFVCNGFDRPFMTQGSAATTYQIGINPVTPAQYAGVAVALGPVVGATGLTAGTHRFAYRYRSTITGARSQPYIVGNSIVGSTTVVAAGGESLNFTIGAAAVSADAQVTTIDVFMQEANALVDAPYFFICSFNNAAGGPFAIPNVTYTDISDPSNMVRERLDVDDELPLVASRDFETWRGRLLAITSDYTVAYSKQRFDGNSYINLPTSWPGDNELEVGRGDGDPLVKIIKYYDYIIAFKRRSVWVLLGDFDSADFGFKRLKSNVSNIGLLNPRSVVQAGNSVYFVTDDLKFYSFSATDFSTAEIRLPDKPLSDPIADLFTVFASSYRNNVNLVNYSWSQYSQIFASFSDGSSGLNAANNFNCFVYDYELNAWTIHTKVEIASSVLARDAARNYRVYVGDYYGFVWKLGDTNGDGAAINGTLASATPLTFTTTLPDLPFPINNLIGTFITIIGGTGLGQIRRISSITSTTSGTITTAWTILPDATSQYTIGGIDFQVQSRWDWCDLNSPPDFDKYGWYLDLDVNLGFIPTVMDPVFNQPVGGGAYGFGFTLEIFKNRTIYSTAVTPREIASAGAVWDNAFWDVDLWADSVISYVQAGLDLYFKQISFRITNNKAGQDIQLNGHTWCYQSLERVRPT